MSGAKEKGNTKWKKTRHDKYYKLAKEQGYRSRACFKLIHLNKLHDFLSSCRAVVDLCAAPGGWLQVCSKFMPVGSLIIGIDLLPIKSMRGVLTMQQDITTQKCRTELKKNLQGWNLDCVLHDGAPNMGGATWHADAFTQIELVVHSLRLATEFLRPGGWFITKIFRSQDYNALLWALNHFFKKVTTTKPPASRNASAEIFAICEGFVAPKKFDKRLLDPEHLFSHIEPEKKVANPFNAKKVAKKNRSGYEDGVSLLYKPLSVAEFVSSRNPVEALAIYDALKFDEASQVYKEHSATTEDIVALCADLKVLGKGDLRALLKWLKKLREYKKSLEQEEEDEEEEDEESEEQLTEAERKELEEAQLTEQLEEMHAKMIAGKTKAKRKRMERKKKEAARLALNALTPFDIAAEEGEDGLFNLGDIKHQDDIDTLHDQKKIIELEEDPDKIFSESEEDGSDSDAMLARMQDNLDTSYAQFKERRGVITRQRRKKLGLEEEEEEEEMESEAEELLAATGQVVAEEEEEEEADNKLLVDFGQNKKKHMSASQITKQFFDRDLFAGFEADADENADDDEGDSEVENMDEANDSEDEEEEEEDEEEQEEHEVAQEITAAELKKRLKRKRKRNKQRAKQRQKRIKTEEQDTKTDGKKSSKKTKSKKAKKTKDNKKTKDGKKTKDSKKTAQSAGKNNDSKIGETVLGGKQLKGVSTFFLNAQTPTENVFLTNVIVDTSRKQVENTDDRFDNPDGDFEEVPESDFDSFSDTDAEAETMALGKMMIRHKSRNKLIDDSYNRYTWDDPEDLPDWFADSERGYNTRPLPITKAQVDSFKEKLKAINARPIKKMAEAKARKKMRTMKRWEKLKAKAETIANNEGGTEAQKLQTISKLYKKQDKRKVKQDKIYLVSKKAGGQSRHGNKGRGKIVNVDRRLKNDMRAQRKAEKKKSGKRRKPQKRRKR